MEISFVTSKLEALKTGTLYAQLIGARTLSGERVLRFDNCNSRLASFPVSGRLGALKVVSLVQPTGTSAYLTLVSWYVAELLSSRMTCLFVGCKFYMVEGR